MILLLLAGAPAYEDLRDRFLDRDLVGLIEGRGRLDARFDVGRLGLLDDLSRLVRCLPLGPIPSDEDPELRGIRTLARLERVRLEQLSRDGLHAATSLGKLLERGLYTTSAEIPSSLVVWPLEAERWPNERRLDRPKAPSCPKHPGELKEKRGSSDVNRTARARASRELTAEVLTLADHLPSDARGRVALAYLDDARAAGSAFVVPETWLLGLEAAVDVASPPERTAGRLLLSRQLERAAKIERASLQLRAVLQDSSRTADEDSRSRVRLVFLLEAQEPPRYLEILEVIRGAHPRSGSDTTAMVVAEARALLSLGRTQELMTLGRRWLKEKRPDGPLELQIESILFSVALLLEPPEAMGWVEEMSGSSRDDRGQTRDLARLAELAASEKRYDLAVAIYDRLRLEAKRDRTRLGPRAAQIEARWLRERALVEYERRDVGAFAAFVDEISALAAEESDRPLARYAPHRAVARLCQDLMPRLTQEVPVDSERKKFAALLLEVVTKLANPVDRSPFQRAPAHGAVARSLNTTKDGGRHGKILEAYVAPLTAMAAEYAEGRAGRRPTSLRRVRQLGEVLVPRLPPRIEPADVPTPVPPIDSFLVFEDRDGRWRSGPPWLLAKVGVDSGRKD